MNKTILSKLISEAVKKAIKENLDGGPVSEEQLDDATQLMMLVSGRLMAAHETQVSASVIDQVIHHIEQADGLLAKAGLKADSADLSGISENRKPRTSQVKKK